jgi:hypothetical protein
LSTIRLHNIQRATLKFDPVFKIKMLGGSSKLAPLFLQCGLRRALKQFWHDHEEER